MGKIKKTLPVARRDKGKVLLDIERSKLELLGVASQFENPKNKKECHASESWHPDQIAWIPAFAGMTLKMKLRHYHTGIF